MKTGSEQPTLRNGVIIIFTLYLAVYLAGLSARLVYGRDWVLGIPDFIMLEVSAFYIIRGLIKQIALFFDKNLL